MIQRMLGTDGKEYKFRGAKGELQNWRKTSKLHASAKKLVKELFPASFVSEEVSIQINRSRHLYIDIYLPTFFLAIEVHGKQHLEYNSHFFKSYKSFTDAQGRDLEKKEWCSINDVILVELFYNESYDEWREKIRRVVR